MDTSENVYNSKETIIQNNVGTVNGPPPVGKEKRYPVNIDKCKNDLELLYDQCNVIISRKLGGSYNAMQNYIVDIFNYETDKNGVAWLPGNLFGIAKTTKNEIIKAAGLIVEYEKGLLELEKKGSIESQQNEINVKSRINNEEPLYPFEYAKYAEELKNLYIKTDEKMRDMKYGRISQDEAEFEELSFQADDLREILHKNPDSKGIVYLNASLCMMANEYVNKTRMMQEELYEDFTREQEIYNDLALMDEY